MEMKVKIEAITFCYFFVMGVRLASNLCICVCVCVCMCVCVCVCICLTVQVSFVEKTTFSP